MNHRKIANFAKIEDHNMEQLIKTDSEYSAWIADLRKRYMQSQIRASVGINREVLAFYWSVGRDICNMDIEKRWGQGPLLRPEAVKSPGVSFLALPFRRAAY